MHEQAKDSLVSEKEKMHAAYRSGGARRGMAPHVVYSDQACPHDGCSRSMRAIDFRLEDYGPAVHDPLVQAWWADTGFAGQCPACGGWVHFTIRQKRALQPSEAARLPQLPADWFKIATIL